MGISKTEDKYWVNELHSKCGYSPIGSETAFPPTVIPVYFTNKQEWIDRCNELDITVDDEYLD